MSIRFHPRSQFDGFDAGPRPPTQTIPVGETRVLDLSGARRFGAISNDRRVVEARIVSTDNLELRATGVGNAVTKVYSGQQEARLSVQSLPQVGLGIRLYYVRDSRHVPALGVPAVRARISSASRILQPQTGIAIVERGFEPLSLANIDLGPIVTDEEAWEHLDPLASREGRYFVNLFVVWQREPEEVMRPNARGVGGSNAGAFPRWTVVDTADHLRPSTIVHELGHHLSVGTELMLYGRTSRGVNVHHSQPANIMHRSSSGQRINALEAQIWNGRALGAAIVAGAP